jgi:hypothetical protein
MNLKKNKMPPSAICPGAKFEKISTLTLFQGKNPIDVSSIGFHFHSIISFTSRW